MCVGGAKVNNTNHCDNPKSSNALGIDIEDRMWGKERVLAVFYDLTTSDLWFSGLQTSRLSNLLKERKSDLATILLLFFISYTHRS